MTRATWREALDGIVRECNAHVRAHYQPVPDFEPDDAHAEADFDWLAPVFAAAADAVLGTVAHAVRRHRRMDPRP